MACRKKTKFSVYFKLFEKNPRSDALHYVINTLKIDLRVEVGLTFVQSIRNTKN